MHAVLCLWLVAVQSVSQLDDPRPTHHVVDQAAALAPDGEAAADRAIARLHDTTGVELLVAVVDDVPGSPKAFATALFARLRLGTAARNDGVLVLLVMDQRRLEIETGDGLQTELSAAWLAELQAREMVPRLRQRDVAGALVAGIDAIEARLRALPAESEAPVVPGEYRSDGVVVPRASAAEAAPAQPATPSTPTIRVDLRSRHSPPAPPAATTVTDDEPGSGRGFPWNQVLTGGLLAVGLGGFGFAGRRAYLRSITCTGCQQRMNLLDEQADDAYLQPGQRVEERLGSVDYRVRFCPRCQTTRISNYWRFLSPYRPCPACRHRTASKRSTTIIPATEEHPGLVRVEETCAHCDHHAVTSFSTPQRSRASSDSASPFGSSDSVGSSSSFDSSSSSGSSSSFDSSSSSGSSGSSDSGGSSSGGGAGSSW